MFVVILPPMMSRLEKCVGDFILFQVTEINLKKVRRSRKHFPLGLVRNGTNLAVVVELFGTLSYLIQNWISCT